MGARLYNPTTGRFLSVDPVPGGNANDYDYCTADPINCTDLNGQWGFKRFMRQAAGWAGKVSTYAGYVPFCGHFGSLRKAGRVGRWALRTRAVRRWHRANHYVKNVSRSFSKASRRAGRGNFHKYYFGAHLHFASVGSGHLAGAY